MRFPYRIAFALAYFLTDASFAQTVITALRPNGHVKGQTAESAPPAGLVTSPTLGFIFDKDSGSIHRIEGVPGAASIAEAIFPSFPVLTAATAPQHDYLLAVNAEDGQVVVLFTGAGKVTAEQVIEGVPPAPDRIEFSPSGRSAVLYYAAARTIWTLKSLPLEAAAAEAGSLSSWTGDLTALAVDNTGKTVLAGVTAGESGTLLQFHLDTAGQPIFSGGRLSNTKFFTDSNDAVVLDQEFSRVSRITGLPAGAQSDTLLGESDGITHPKAVAITPDSGHLVLLEQSGSDVVLFSLENRTLQRLSCESPPDGISPLKANFFYQVAPAHEGKVMVLAGSVQAPRIAALTGGRVSMKKGGPRR